MEAGSIADSSGGGPTAQVSLPGGLVFLNHPGSWLLASPIGDLDGDGLRDFWVGAAPTSQAQVPSAAWVLPGSTVAGTYDISTVGIAIPPGAAAALAGPSYDWNGDGRDDLVLVGASSTTVAETFVLPGLAVMAAGPGGDATAVPRIFQTPGALMGRVAVPGQGTVVVTAAPLDSITPEAAGLLWLTGPSGVTAFATTPTRFAWFRTVEVIDSGASGVFLYGRYDDRARGVEVVWRLDDPCGGLPPAAAPAQSVAVIPAVTG